jgi:hypothetical protein
MQEVQNHMQIYSKYIHIIHIDLICRQSIIHRVSYREYKHNPPLTLVTAGRTIKRRDFKHFYEVCFLDGLSQLNWDVIQNYDDPNDMWRIWVDMLMNVVNKHAPIRETRIGKKRSPWITPNILQQMRSRDYFKKKFETTKDISTWNLYKKARNEVNNNLKQSKRDYLVPIFT